MKTKLIAVAVSALVLSACSSSPVVVDAQPPRVVSLTPIASAATLSALPKWYLTGAEDTDTEMYAAGTGVSRDLAMAQAKATLDAQRKIADKLQADVDAMVKEYKRETGVEFSQSYEQITRKLISNVRVVGYGVTNQMVMAENGAYRVFVQLRYPIGETNKALRAIDERLAQRKGVAAQQRIEQQLDEQKAQREAQTRAEIAEVGPKLQADNSGIVIRGTEASPTSKPLSLGDSAEER